MRAALNPFAIRLPLFDPDAFLVRTRGAFAEAERLMRDENPSLLADTDGAWDNESLRADRKVDAAVVDRPEN